MRGQADQADQADQAGQPSQPILFYKKGEDFDFFTNVVETPFEVFFNNTKYPVSCSEAVYQATKAFLDPSSGGMAKDLLTRPAGARIQQMAQAIQGGAIHQSYGQGSSEDKLSIPGGNREYAIKHRVMYETLLCKFTQNPILLKALLSTGNAKLIENTFRATAYDDSEWGNGKKGDGKNALGQILMRIRNELRDEKNTGKIAVRVGFSEPLCRALKWQYQEDQHISKERVITQDSLDRLPLVNITTEFQEVAAVQSQCFQQSMASSSSTPVQLMTQEDINRVCGRAREPESGDGQKTRDGYLEAVKKFLTDRKLPIDSLSVRFVEDYNGIYLLFLPKGMKQFAPEFFKSTSQSSLASSARKAYSHLCQEQNFSHFDLLDVKHPVFGEALKTASVVGVIKVSKEATHSLFSSKNQVTPSASH